MVWTLADAGGKERVSPRPVYLQPRSHANRLGKCAEFGLVYLPIQGDVLELTIRFHLRQFRSELDGVSDGATEIALAILWSILGLLDTDTLSR